MEVPEKIYVTEGMLFATNPEITLPNNDNIEYVRTDTLIDKACDAYCKVCGHYPHKTPTHICRQDCDYFENFKRYLKGGEE